MHQETLSLSPGLDDSAGPPWPRSVLSRNHKRDFPLRLSPEREGGVDYTRAVALSVVAATASLSTLTGPRHSGPSRIRSRVLRRSTPLETVAAHAEFRASAPRSPRRLAASAGAPPRYGGEGGIRAGYRRWVLRVSGGDRKVDGGGHANGESPGDRCRGWELLRLSS